MGIRQRTSKSLTQTTTTASSNLISPLHHGSLVLEVEDKDLTTNTVTDDCNVEDGPYLKTKTAGPTSSISRLSFSSSFSFFLSNSNNSNGNHGQNRIQVALSSFRWILACSTVTLLLFTMSTMNLAISSRQASEVANASPRPVLEPVRSTGLWFRTASSNQRQKSRFPPRIYQMMTTESGHWLRSQSTKTKTAWSRKLAPLVVVNGNDTEPVMNGMLENTDTGRFTQPPIRESQNGDDQECIPMASWQVASYPTCNDVHGIDMRTYLSSTVEWSKSHLSSSSFNPNVNSHHTADETTTNPPLTSNLSILAKGWFRTTWQWHNQLWGQDEAHDIVVLKTLRMEREFLSEYYDLHNRDAVAMERLSFSPHVVNIYGYCGQSAINEYADFPHGDGNVKSLEKLNRKMRGKRNVQSMLLRLIIATSLASGLAHVHQAGNQWQADLLPPRLANKAAMAGNALMVHYDINPRNIALFKGGRPKINDFNIAEFVRYNPVTQKPCGFESRMHSPWWRSPEEVRMSNNATMTRTATTKTPTLLNEKVDVYALGSTLFHLFSSYSPRGKMTLAREELVRNQVLAGQAPELLKEFQMANDTVSQAFRHVIQKCHAFDPRHRWSAKQIAHYLLQTLHNKKDELMQVVQRQGPKESKGSESVSSVSSSLNRIGDDSASLAVSSQHKSDAEKEEEEEEAFLERKG